MKNWNILNEQNDCDVPFPWESISLVIYLYYSGLGPLTTLVCSPRDSGIFLQGMGIPPSKELDTTSRPNDSNRFKNKLACGLNCLLFKSGLGPVDTECILIGDADVWEPYSSRY